LANKVNALPGQANKKCSMVSTPAINGPIPGGFVGSEGWLVGSGGEVASGVVPGMLHAASKTAAISKIDLEVFMLYS
jgi:hypothetical protein